jgi:hypothetical protein
VSILAQPDDLAALNRQITDEEGEIVGEETPQEETATQEQTTVEEDATAEKSAETEESIPIDDKETENEPEMVETASDETGKRYVPESRFKEVYAKWKKAERKAKERGVTPPPMPVVEPKEAKPIDKTDALETELLRSTLPQFNPESPDYSREIDELGYSLYEGSRDPKGNYTMTRLDAGRKALQMAKKITSKLADLKLEARTVKAQQSDQGITNRVLNRDETKVDPMKMSLEEKEEWLRANGHW